MTVKHYENFPVASLLCPAALRPAVSAIYAYARMADDIADEGDASPSQRLADLAAYRRDLEAIAAGRDASARWQLVFAPLKQMLARHRLPLSLLLDLLSAFSQDVVKHSYTDRAELLDYCRRSANPIGRLLLHLYDVSDDASLVQSDAICTSLQLINFWQDLSVDTPRGRLYVPLADCERHHVAPGDMLARHDSAVARRLIADMADWARTLMETGAPLVHALPGRAGYELRLVVQGGLRVLEKIERMDYAVLVSRPKLNAADSPVMLWRALRMRAQSASLSRHAA